MDGRIIPTRFNNYSFFDVDYLERPGSDAFRIQYYTGSLSGPEAVVKVDSAHRYTVAGMFKTNYRGYDLQLLAGNLAGEDLTVGLGWAGGQRKFHGVITQGRGCHLVPRGIRVLSRTGPDMVPDE